MPKFDTVPLNEAQLQSSTGKRAALIREYVGYVEKVAPGQAGRLGASAGESLTAVRRRLGAAARYLGKTLVIRRNEDYVYFWVDEDTGRRRRSTRRAKAASPPAR